MNEVLGGRTDNSRARMEVDRKLLHLWFHVHPGFNMRNVQCITKGLYMTAQQRILGTEDSIDTRTHLKACYKLHNFSYVKDTSPLNDTNYILYVLCYELCRVCISKKYEFKYVTYNINCFFYI